MQVFAAAGSLAKQGWKYEMKASMVEVYNEEYKDLLGKGPPAGKKHQVNSVYEESRSHTPHATLQGPAQASMRLGSTAKLHAQMQGGGRLIPPQSKQLQ